MEVKLGFCHCCRSNTEFTIHGEWLRDQYLCNKCGSIPRQRHLQHILDRYFSNWESRSIHESSPSNQYIAQYAKDYSFSQYLTDVPFGAESESGVRSEDLENLSFGAESIDIFITQDVFEHLFDPERAAKEIARTLVPGGVHIFTTPKYEGLRKSYPRSIRCEDGTVKHLHEPEYHGNPVGDGKSLVTWHYGDDFEYLLSRWSGLTITTYVTRDRSLGIDATFNEVFVMTKAKGSRS